MTRPPRFHKANPRPVLRGVCRGCGKPAGNGRRSWCSSECWEAHWVRASNSIMKEQVRKRDKGICALCSLNCIALLGEYRVFITSHGVRLTQFAHRDPLAAAWLDFHHIPYRRRHAALTWGDWWDADHIIPVSEGGGACGLENIRTLCIPCHKEVTRQMHAKQAKERKARKVSIEIEMYLAAVTGESL